MALSPSQQALLARAYLSKCEWYQHGQSGQAAQALARAGLVLFRKASGGINTPLKSYIPPAIMLTEAGIREAQQLPEGLLDEAIAILEAQQRNGQEPK